MKSAVCLLKNEHDITFRKQVTLTRIALHIYNEAKKTLKRTKRYLYFTYNSVIVKIAGKTEPYFGTFSGQNFSPNWASNDT